MTFFDLSIPLKFNGEQPNVYGVEPASSKACEYGDLVGDTRRGGSVNFEEYSFIPHCNGTHTECVGHITDERITINECLKDISIDAILISVEVEKAGECGDKYFPTPEPDDLMISKRNLKEALKQYEESPISGALIVRTLPNDDTKKTMAYESAPYFSNEAIEYILGFDHLLCDLPSIDRMRDDGNLSNHRLFWDVDSGSKEIKEETRVQSTITELIYVPDEVEDGTYQLNLQIPPFESDAAPSRPIIWKPQIRTSMFRREPDKVIIEDVS